MTAALYMLGIAWAAPVLWAAHSYLTLDELEADLERRIEEPEEDDDIANDNEVPS